ncbi:MAG: hypothetical protein DRJ62_02825 [Thermoprotei archaeon]|nr:MAG: hypothetical protein DRJ62_02825 [Thermoprotei archaeon]
MHGGLALSSGIESYEFFIGKRELNSILRLAEEIKDFKVLHLSSSKSTPAVELLKSLVPLLNSLGVNAKWKLVEGEPARGVAARVSRALQGLLDLDFPRDVEKVYVEAQRAIRGSLRADLVMVHDVELLPLVVDRGFEKWVWRCYSDISRPSPSIWPLAKRLVEMYDALVFPCREVMPRDLDLGKALVIHPSIDPLSDRNKPLSETEILSVLSKFDVDPDRPIIGQVCDFELYSNHKDLLRVFERVRERRRGVQLVVVGRLSSEGAWGLYEELLRLTCSCRDVHVLTDVDGVGDLELNALQRSFTVALHLSSRDGFGLSVAEALWKAIPVVAYPVGSIPLQVVNGLTGLLANSLEEVVDKTLMLMKKPWLARELGQRGRDHVKRNFLITRDLKDCLKLYACLLKSSSHPP